VAPRTLSVRSQQPRPATARLPRPTWIAV